MCPLQPRYACLQCPPSAPCSVFVESALDPQTNTVVPRLIPTSSSQLCVSCQHPWIAHEGKPCGDPSHINFAFHRAGCTDTKCGGFFADQPRWSFLTICVCLAAWMSHGAVPETPAPGLNSDPAGIAPAWALRTQLSVSAPSPMSAFSGTPPEVTGSVGGRRMASAQRTLPHNQLATTSSAPSNYRGARRSFPAGSNPFGANPTLLVAVYSMVVREKLHGYFFIWMCIRRAWLRKSAARVYWKYRHARSGDTKFELRRFWKYGGPLVLEQEPGVAEPDISPEMASSSSGRLEPMHFTDDSIKALVLWDLALCHSQLQLDRADELLCASSITDPVELSVRRTRRADVFYSPDWNWNITNQVPPWEKALSDKGRRRWLSRLLEIVKDWPCASKMAWFLAENGFHAIKQHVGKPHEAKFCEQLSDGKVQMLENSMVAAYYQGVFDSMGILAIGIMKRPKHMPSMNAFYLM
ncbi:hypothetical protein DFH09DRAFT_1462004 [Mycena vulgaris]|nr:hypothetical protein DFH09DRAFT_1462004 [Mycena vulgaris]